MREYLRRAGGKIGSGLERYRSFSGLQRILVVLSGGGVLVLLAMVLVAGGATGYREVLSESDRDGPVRLQEAATLLDRHGIPWKSTTREDGVRAIAVPDGAPHDRARALLVGPSDSAALLGPESPLRDASPWETPGRLNSRVQDFNRQKLEQALLGNPAIQSANIILSGAPGRAAPEPGGFRKGGSSGGSAAVLVRLRGGVALLTRREANDLRATVSCGFNISPENITVSDGFRTYPGATASQLEAEGLEEKEERTCARVREEIRRHYSTVFAESEFQVGVIASVSPRRSSIEEKTVDREKSFSLATRTEFQKGGAPSGGIMFASGESQLVSVREVSESIPFESWRKTQTDVPPGEVKGVSVIVHLDLAAVERVDAQRRPGTSGDRADESPRGLAFDRDDLLDRYAARQETALRNLLGGLGDIDISVGVMIHPFSKTLAGGAALASTLAAAQDGGASGESPAGSAPGWRSVTVAIALGLGLLLAGAAVLLRRGSRRAEKLAASTPAGGAQSGMEGSRVGGAPHLSRAGFRLRRAGFPADELHDAVLGAVGEMSASVRERPETASSVLRLWLAQDREDAKERAHRS
ncbi:MAG TPA: hypothetical protein VMT52_16295 [Planctomycetota bacterium]|nr:hypothetical protein [Planctomycetota bacterium]